MTLVLSQWLQQHLHSELKILSFTVSTCHAVGLKNVPYRDPEIRKD